LDCNGIATDSGRHPEPPHAVLQPGLLHVQVRARLLNARVPEDVLNVMQRPAGLEHARRAFVSQIVKVQIDGLQQGGLAQRYGVALSPIIDPSVEISRSVFGHHRVASPL
jgi:hypothetical protein